MGANPAMLYKKEAENILDGLYWCGQIEWVLKTTKMYDKNQWGYYDIKYADRDGVDYILDEILNID